MREGQDQKTVHRDAALNQTENTLCQDEGFTRARSR